MAKATTSTGSPNGFVLPSSAPCPTLQQINFPDDGLADDDSWVESISHDDDELNELDSALVLNFDKDYQKDVEYNSNDIDFTLHTIVEESCEDSELEHGETNLKHLEDQNCNKNLLPSELEKYFYFGLGNGDVSNINDDSSSEVFSDCSDIDSAVTNNVCTDDNPDLSTSRLEKYFLSGFMGFSENKSDGSVGSDSEGQPSPNQRKKKFVRARGAQRSHNCCFDSLLLESTSSALDKSLKESSESETSSQSESKANCHRYEDSDFIKRKKNYKKRELDVQNCGAFVLPDFLQSDESSEYRYSTELPENASLVRKDSFNNWSSDEETNLMMSKMRQFFKTIIAVKGKNNTSAELQYEKPLNQIKSSQFPYFEKELVRLMKIVPDINDQQFRDIVGYFSAEDSLSDTVKFSNLQSKAKINLVRSDANNATNHRGPFPDVDAELVKHSLSAKTALVCKSFIESLIVNNSCMRRDDAVNEEQTTENLPSKKSKEIASNFMQHVGDKLVALMHEVSANEHFVPHSNQNSGKTLGHFDCSLPTLYQRANLPRSKSHDVLLGSTKRTCHFSSNSAVNENTGEVSDCDRFSWRGSFESALLAPGDSRTKLLSVDRDSSPFTSKLPVLKRGSVDNIMFKNENKESLDRVQSCGSIEFANQSNSIDIDNPSLTLPFDTENKTGIESQTLEIKAKSFANPFSQITDRFERDSSINLLNVKSARYRPSALESNVYASSFSKKKLLQTSRIHPKDSSFPRGQAANILPDNVLSTQPQETNDLQQNNLFALNSTDFAAPSANVCNENNTDDGNMFVKVKGKINFALQYNYKVSSLEINIVKCIDLAAADAKRCKSDPYVKVYLLPDKSKSGKRKTKVKKNTLNPIFNEIIRFNLPMSNLQSRSIWLTVWHSDIFGRNNFLGEVTVDLRGKVFDNPQSQWYCLHERNGKSEDRLYYGDIVIGLKFVPLGTFDVPSPDPNYNNLENLKPSFKGQLHVLVKEAKNLNPPRVGVACDTFCKSYLLPDRARGAKQKTPVFKKSLNPFWNFTFVYEDVTLEELSDRALELTVWEHDRLISNQFLGGARLSLDTANHNGNMLTSMDSRGNELYLWKEMLSRPNFWVEGSVKLRPNVHVKQDESF